MRRKGIAVLLAVLLLVGMSGVGAFAAVSVQKMTLSAEDLSHDISEDLYGIFIEDINNAVEGGLNANLVRNNSFEYLYWANPEKPLSGWEIEGEYTRETTGGMHENNPAYISLPQDDTVKTRTVKNIGFCEYFKYKTYERDDKVIDVPSIAIQAGETYAFSAWFKNTDMNVTVYLENQRGEKLSDTVSFGVHTGEKWEKSTAVLSAAKSGSASLVMEFESGAASLDYVCLYPEKSYGYGTETWKYTSLRADLFQALLDMHPAFVRFPGGCVTEGVDLANNFNWKDTIGPLETRKQSYNIWQTDLIDYNNSYSVGYHEYFQLCADIGAKPVPILNVGLTCQPRNGYDGQYYKYRSGEITEEQWEEYLDTIALRPGTAEFDAYVQDILDLIEYANGDVSTEWGARRAANGHPEPFDLEYLGLGNENWGVVYFRNLAALKEAIQAVYPDIQVISSSGPVCAGLEFDKSWKELTENYADTIVDEHYYQQDVWYLANLDRYDNYDRSGPKVFLGEYAATATQYGTIQTKSNLKAAISEAAYMTSLERNGDVVVMSSYAPLFGKINAQEWTINLIWFDAQNAVLSPSYYTQMLFMNNTGSRYLDVDLPEGNDGVYQSITVDEENELIYIKLVNTTGEKKAFSYSLVGFGPANYADMLTLSDHSLAACNESGKTTTVPKAAKVMIEGDPTFKVDGYSVNVLRIAYGTNKTGEGLYELPQMPEATRYYTAVERVLLYAVPALVIVLSVGVFTAVHLIRRKRKKASA